MSSDDKRRPKVLIVDDEPEVAKALRRMLTRRGFDVETVTSAAEALERLEPLTPDIVISGQTDLGDAAGGVSAAGHHVLPKPWDNDELVAALNAALGAKAGP
jgi:DNA-binding response OmpR family regulator